MWCVYGRMARLPPTDGSIVEPLTDFQQDVRAVLDELHAELIKKNESYGNSALEPLHVFARGVSAADGLAVQIDHKLNRIAKGHEFPGDDTVSDLVGYLVIELVRRRRAKAA